MRFSISTLAAVTASLAAALAGNAHAADGAISINGLVMTQTCLISGSGGGADITVILPTILASVHSTAGAMAGRTPFNASC